MFFEQVGIGMQKIIPSVSPVQYVDYVVANKGSSFNDAITIPAGATFALIAVTFYPTCNVSGVSLDGHAATLIDSLVTANMLNLYVFRVSGFSVGANKTFVCNLDNDIYGGANATFLFFSGVNAAPVHDHKVLVGTQNQNETLTTDAMSSSINDMVVALVCGQAIAITMTGGGQTLVISALYHNVEHGTGYKQGTGATDTATCITSYGGIIGVTLSPV